MTCRRLKVPYGLLIVQPQSMKRCFDSVYFSVVKINIIRFNYFTMNFYFVTF